MLDYGSLLLDFVRFYEPILSNEFVFEMKQGVTFLANIIEINHWSLVSYNFIQQ